jgi:hypothetical protein
VIAPERFRFSASESLWMLCGCIFCGEPGSALPENAMAPDRRDRGDTVMSDQAARGQLLHLVFGGELTELDKVEFRDLDKLDLVGIFPNYASAHAAWKAKAQQTVDNALMRYFIVHLHRLLDPETDQHPG